MKQNLRTGLHLRFAWIFFLAPFFAQAQCEIFKSEMDDLKIYMTKVSHLADSLQTYAESAAFGAQYNAARSNARKVKFLIGVALNEADEAVTMASSAQYHSEICGLSAVKTYTIDVENYITDARNFADEAFINAKNAIAARNLGDVRYYMRRSQNASQEARNSANAAAHATYFAHASCTHANGQTVSIEE